MEYGHGEYALIFKALSDETRLKIMTMLTRGKTCACKILEEFHFTQPTLSYHMKQLTDCGLVDADKEGKWVYYSINKKRVGLIGGLITEISQVGNSAECCEGECDD
jgi:ArsR family transcriptional regulator